VCDALGKNEKTLTGNIITAASSAAAATSLSMRVARYVISVLYTLEIEEREGEKER
jgi:hypothetical protein